MNNHVELFPKTGKSLSWEENTSSGYAPLCCWLSTASATWGYVHRARLNECKKNLKLSKGMRCDTVVLLSDSGGACQAGGGGEWICDEFSIHRRCGAGLACTCVHRIASIEKWWTWRHCQFPQSCLACFTPLQVRTHSKYTPDRTNTTVRYIGFAVKVHICVIQEELSYTLTAWQLFRLLKLRWTLSWPSPWMLTTTSWLISSRPCSGYMFSLTPQAFSLQVFNCLTLTFKCSWIILHLHMWPQSHATNMNGLCKSLHNLGCVFCTAGAIVWDAHSPTGEFPNPSGGWAQTWSPPRFYSGTVCWGKPPTTHTPHVLMWIWCHIKKWVQQKFICTCKYDLF